MKTWIYLVANWEPDDEAIGGYQWDEFELLGESLTGGLDKLGAQGWEMCASHVVPGGKPTFQYVFKMPGE